VHNIGHSFAGLPYKQITLLTVVVHDVPLPVLEELHGSTGVTRQGVVPIEACHHPITWYQDATHAFVPDGHELALEGTTTSFRHDLHMPVVPGVGDNSVPPCVGKVCKSPLPLDPPLCQKTRQTPFLCTDLTAEKRKAPELVQRGLMTAVIFPL